MAVQPKHSENSESLSEPMSDDYQTESMAYKSNQASGIEATTQHGEYSVSDEEIVFELFNKGAITWNYGLNFILEFNDQGTWKIVNRSVSVDEEIAVPAIENILRPDHRATHTLQLSEYRNTITQGKYRVIIYSIEGEWTSAEFEFI